MISINEFFKHNPFGLPEWMGLTLEGCASEYLSEGPWTQTEAMFDIIRLDHYVESTLYVETGVKNER